MNAQELDLQCFTETIASDKSLFNVNVSFLHQGNICDVFTVYYSATSGQIRILYLFHGCSSPTLSKYGTEKKSCSMADTPQNVL